MIDPQFGTLRRGVALALMLVLVTLPQTVAADDEPALARSTFEELSEAQDAMNKGRFGQALASLRQLLVSIGDGPAYDRAVVMQTIGFAELGQGDRAAAIRAFEQALAPAALPEKPRLNVLQVLGRLYAAEQNYQNAREALEQWFAATQAQPKADDYLVLANVYAQLAAYDQGIEAIREAIRLHSEPVQSHYKLLIAMLYESGRYSEAVSTLTELIARWPGEKRYWTQLANIYINIDEELKAHSVLMLAYRKGLLDSQSELLTLVKLAMAAGVPASGARVLEKELQSGGVASTESHWQLLASAWEQAKETEQAIAAYDRAAQFSGDGEYALRQASLHMQGNDWQKVVASAQQALAKGGLASPGQAWLLSGMGYLHLKQYTQSLQALEQARHYDQTVGTASQWMEYVRRRREMGT